MIGLAAARSPISISVRRGPGSFSLVAEASRTRGCGNKKMVRFFLLLFAFWLLFSACNRPLGESRRAAMEIRVVWCGEEWAFFEEMDWHLLGLGWLVLQERW